MKPCKIFTGCIVLQIYCHSKDLAMGGNVLDNIVAKLLCWCQISHQSISCSHSDYWPLEDIYNALCMTKQYLTEREMFSFLLNYQHWLHQKLSFMLVN